MEPQTRVSLGATTWYPDGDEDGYGDSDAGTTSCESPSGYIETAGDCDDGDSDINPDADDVCDGLDNDCDGEVDAGALVSVWYLDADGDGYGDSDTGVEACEQPSNHVAEDGDCDDGDDELNPGAFEVCISSTTIAMVRLMEKPGRCDHLVLR